MDQITFDEFKKIDIRIGKIISAQRIEDSEKLLKLIVDFGQEQRQIIAGIAKSYLPEHLEGKECPFVFNLQSKYIKGLESQGMVLCANNSGNPVLLHTDKEVEPGSLIK